MIGIIQIGMMNQDGMIIMVKIIGRVSKKYQIKGMEAGFVCGPKEKLDGNSCQ
jgi:hypothetical protein